MPRRARGSSGGSSAPSAHPAPSSVPAVVWGEYGQAGGVTDGQLGRLVGSSTGLAGDICPVCLRASVRGRRRTCSGQCAELWRVVRFWLDDGEWRKHCEAVARKDARVREALRGSAEPLRESAHIERMKGRRMPRKGSKVGEGLARVWVLRGRSLDG